MGTVNGGTIITMTAVGCMVVITAATIACQVKMTRDYSRYIKSDDMLDRYFGPKEVVVETTEP